MSEDLTSADAADYRTLYATVPGGTEWYPVRVRTCPTCGCLVDEAAQHVCHRRT